MEAKDTVMSPKKLQLLGQQYEDDVPTCDFTHYALEKQAEITGKIKYDEGFKAGEKNGYANAWQHLVDVIVPQERADAIREVVEWIEKHPSAYDGWGQEWQAQLKEWGIINES